MYFKHMYAFNSKKKVSEGLLQRGDHSRSFGFLRAPFLNKKANKSHPMHGTAIFWNERLSVHFFKSALSRQVHNTSRLKI